MADHTFAGLRCSEVDDLAASFVLGALESVESDAVRRHLGDCPEAHAEVAELYSVVPALMEATDLVAPPASLKGWILDAAAADTQRPATDVQRPPAAVGGRAPTPAAVEERQPGWAAWFRRPIWAPVALAAALAVVALGAWNLQLRSQMDALAAYQAGVSAVLAQAAEPGAQLAVLVPTEGSGPSGLAAVAADGRVAVVVRDLAPTTGTQVYETWLIAGQDAPVAIGGFTVTATGAASFMSAHASLGEGVVVALTLEPAPGATAPAGPVVVVGQAQAQSS